MENIIWKPINNFPNYLISNIGSVKSIKRKIKNAYIKKEIILRIGVGTNGYLCAGLHNGRTRKVYMVHRLVAEHFLVKTANYVNHKDSNKLNNNLDNLEWVTNRGNSYHYYNSIGKKAAGVNYTGNGYIVRLRLNKTRFSFGTYELEATAIIVRDKVINELGPLNLSSVEIKAKIREYKAAYS